MQQNFRNIRLRSAAGLIALAATLGFATSASAQGATRDKLDIAGIRLGMTEAEAKAALRAHDPRGKIDTHRAAFSYTDKVAQFSTPDFLNTVVLSMGGSNNIRVWFSGPIGDVRVIGVSRSEYGIRPPSTLAQYRQSLQAKYGQPTGFNDQSNTQPTWEEAGKPSCVRVAQRGGQAPFIAVGMFMTVAQTGNDPRDIENRLDRDRAQVRNGLLPADLASCGAFVFWNLLGDPVSGLTAGLFDLGAFVATERARNKWVDGLEAEAVRKREAASPAPRL